MSTRTDLPIENAPGATPLTKEVVTFTLADTVNGNEFTHTGRELLIVRNTGVGANTITFQSVALNGRQDPLHNIAVSLAAGEFALFGPFKEGWRQTDGFVQVSGGSATEVGFIVIRLPQ